MWAECATRRMQFTPSIHSPKNFLILLSLSVVTPPRGRGAGTSTSHNNAHPPVCHLNKVPGSARHPADTRPSHPSRNARVLPRHCEPETNIHGNNPWGFRDRTCRPADGPDAKDGVHQPETLRDLCASGSATAIASIVWRTCRRRHRARRSWPLSVATRRIGPRCPRFAGSRSAVS